MSVFLYFHIRPMYQVSQKEFTRLESCGIKFSWLILKNKQLTYQSKANLNMKILLGDITHLIDPEIRKMLQRGLYGNQDPHSILNDSLDIEIKIHL